MGDPDTHYSDVLKVTQAEHMGQSTVKSESAFDDVVSSGYEMLDKWCKTRGYENEIGRDLTVSIHIVVVVVQLLLPFFFFLDQIYCAGGTIPMLHIWS